MCFVEWKKEINGEMIFWEININKYFQGQKFSEWSFKLFPISNFGLSSFIQFYFWINNKIRIVENIWGYKVLPDHSWLDITFNVAFTDTLPSLKVK